MSKHCFQKCYPRIKESKVLVYSTPNIDYTVVMRYILPNGRNTTPVENLHSSSQPLHTNQKSWLQLYWKTYSITELIKKIAVDRTSTIQNMAPVYSNLQGRIQEQCPLAEYIPWSSHSLNIVGGFSRVISKTFFDLIQWL